jgi:hypothetical protein
MLFVSKTSKYCINTKDEIYGQLLFIKESLEKSYPVATTIANNEKNKPIERLKACEFANDMRWVIIRLLVEGPIIIANDC